MFVDASAIIAILTREPEGEEIAGTLDAADNRITSVIAVWEAAVGIFRKKRIAMAEAEQVVVEFLEIARIDVLPVANDELSLALQAFERYGRHRYPDTERNKALNLADCFHYAAAKTRQTSILTKDSGFVLTDAEAIVSANDQ